ncbi:hypothetical protein P3911_004476 [Salmonella enterica]|nr:hypothetical protein [Salmonella enterica]
MTDEKLTPAQEILDHYYDKHLATYNPMNELKVSFDGLIVAFGTSECRRTEVTENSYSVVATYTHPETGEPCEYEAWKEALERLHPRETREQLLQTELHNLCIKYQLTMQDVWEGKLHPGMNHYQSVAYVMHKMGEAYNEIMKYPSYL